MEKEALGQKRSMLQRMPAKESLEAGWIRNTLEDQKVKISQESREKLLPRNIFNNMIDLTYKYIYDLIYEY